MIFACPGHIIWAKRGVGVYSISKRGNTDAASTLPVVGSLIAALVHCCLNVFGCGAKSPEQMAFFKTRSRGGTLKTASHAVPVMPVITYPNQAFKNLTH